MPNTFTPTDRIDVRRFTGYAMSTPDETPEGAIATLEAGLSGMSSAQSDMIRSEFLVPLREQTTAFTASHSGLGISKLGEIEFSPDQLNNRLVVLNALKRGLAMQFGIPVGPLLADAAGIYQGRLTRA